MTATPPVLAEHFTQGAGATVTAPDGGVEGTAVPSIDGVELTPKAVSLAGPPTFDSVEDERLHRKQRLAGALRIFGRFGFGEGVAGHITVRDPEFPDHFWVNPFGLSFRHMKVSDLILVNHHGDVVYGSQPVNRAAFVIHSAIHAARPDVVAAAHSHSPYGKSFSSLGIPLAPITQDACIFYNDHRVIAEQGGAVVFDIEAGKELAAKFPDGKAAIHQNHGLFTVGQSVDEAVFWFVSMERSCQAQLMAMAAGDPIEIRDEYARYTFEQTGFPLAGWFSFQPLWQEICRTDPELFD
jgi:ribulose-5-phosphate 4-epimerase/fuculose-1-phosphate aldolase